MELRSSLLRTPERMPGKTILNCRRWRLPLRARASISSGAMSTLERLGEQGDGGQEFEFHD
jgi:hypothetical protein